MKNILLFVFLSCALSDSYGQKTIKSDSTDRSGKTKIENSNKDSSASAQIRWSQAERFSFISSCIESAKASTSSDSARYFCYCMQEYMENKYPDIKDVVNLTEADLQKPEYKKEAAACGLGYWTSNDRKEFLSECTASAKANGVNEEKATSYCSCMLYKIEKQFPDANTLSAELNDEILKSPKWKAIIQGCVNL